MAQNLEEILPRVSGAEMPMILDAAFAANEADPETQTNVIFEGDPGVGKTAGAKAYGKDRGIPVIHVVTPLMDPLNINGLPVKNDETKRIEFWPLDSLPRLDAPRGILLLDEFYQALPMVQAAWSNVLQGRVAGQWVLPEGWLIVGTGNLPKNKAASHNAPTHIKNRWSRFLYVPTAKHFHQWGTSRDNPLHDAVLDYVSDNPEILQSFDPEAELVGTARTLHKVSAILWGKSTDEAKALLVQATVGPNVGAAIMGLYRAMSGSGLSVDEIVLDPIGVKLPETLSAAISAVRTLAAHIESDEVDPVSKYVDRMVDAFGGEVGETFYAALKEFGDAQSKAAVTNWAEKKGYA